MANLFGFKRASALLFPKCKLITLARNAATQSSKGQLVEISHNDDNGTFDNI